MEVVTKVAHSISHLHHSILLAQNKRITKPDALSFK